MRSLTKLAVPLLHHSNFKQEFTKKFTRMIHSIKDTNHFDTEIANAGERLVIVDFGARWCGPCKTSAPEFERLAKEYNRAVFMKVDVDDCSDLAVRDGIAALPTFVLYRGNVKVAAVQGSKMQVLEERIRDHLEDGDELSNSESVKSTQSIEKPGTSSVHSRSASKSHMNLAPERSNKSRSSSSNRL